MPFRDDDRCASCEHFRFEHDSECLNLDTGEEMDCCSECECNQFEEADSP